MERIVHIARSFEAADQHDRKQSKSLSANERIKISRALRRRVFGKDPVDIKEWHRQK